jgi:phage recombination protein Bet
MNEAIVMAGESAVTRYGFTEEQIALIKSQICKGATDAQLDMFMATCNRLQLDPFAKQIYGTIRKDRKNDTSNLVVQVSIDGFRSVADASSDYQGQVPAQWCGDDGVWHEVWLSKDFPAAARVGVWREGFREPLYAVATWLSYVQTDYDGKPVAMWQKMPDVMLAKCAEALALRKAFPRKLSGVYTPDEMGQADNVVEVRANLGGSMVSAALPSGQTYEDKAQADEKSRVKAISNAWCLEHLPDLEERAAISTEQMMECEPIEDAEIQAAERKAITSSQRALMKSWIKEHSPRMREVFKHPATSSDKSKWWNRMGKWATAAGITADEVKAMMADESAEAA